MSISKCGPFWSGLYVCKTNMIMTGACARVYFNMLYMQSMENEYDCYFLLFLFPTIVHHNFFSEITWGRLNIKMPSYQYRHSHVKDKTVSPTVLSLTSESPYLGKTVFLLRRGPDLLLPLVDLAHPVWGRWHRVYSESCGWDWPRRPSYWTRQSPAPPEEDKHYSDVIMGAIASQITNLTILYSTVYSGADQRKHQSSAPLAFVRGIHRWPVNSPHKGPVTRKCFHLMTSSWNKRIFTMSEIVPISCS